MPHPPAARTVALQVAAAALAALALTRCAQAPLRAEEARADGTPRVVVTGSHIPQRIDPRAGLPATTSPVRIWSRQDLERAGTGPNLAAALSKLDSGL
ncbi:MAG TPA: hypothetical protein VMU15_03065 [Anaeromyxobacter sp.]|nr:hypothetical protein [Anaeromyxobacter sp.]